VTTLTLARGATMHAFEFAGDYTRSDFNITPGKTTQSDSREADAILDRSAELSGESLRRTRAGQVKTTACGYEFLSNSELVAKSRKMCYTVFLLVGWNHASCGAGGPAKENRGTGLRQLAHILRRRQIILCNSQAG
jgi:hypothetical protein